MLYSSSTSFPYPFEEHYARGVDVSWRESIDSDVLRTQLAGHASAHLEDGGFAGTVRDPGMRRISLLNDKVCG